MLLHVDVQVAFVKIIRRARPEDGREPATGGFTDDAKASSAVGSSVAADLHALSVGQFESRNIKGQTEPMRAQFGAGVPVACAAFIAHAGGDGSQRGAEPGSKQWGDGFTQPIGQAFCQPAVNQRPFGEGYRAPGVSARRQPLQADGRCDDAGAVLLRRQRFIFHPQCRQSREARLAGFIGEVAFGGLLQWPRWRLPWRT